MSHSIEAVTVGAASAGLAVGWYLPRAAARIAGPPGPGLAQPTPAYHQAAAGHDQTGQTRLARAASALITGVVVGGLVYRLHASPLMPAAIVTALLGITAALVDLRSHQLPDALVIPGAAVCALSITGVAVFDHDLHHLLRAAIDVGVVTGVLLILAVVTGALGLGDVKTVLWLSILCAWQGLAVLSLAIVAAFVIQAAAATLLLAAGRTSRHASLAFGPALIGAALAALII